MLDFDLVEELSVQLITLVLESSPYRQSQEHDETQVNSLPWKQVLLTTMDKFTIWVA